MSEAAFRVERGGAADLRALERHHYASGSPAPPVRVLRAIDARTGGLVGVLWVSMPALNGAWRAIAWPDAFGGLTARANAATLNRLVRTISRVIVDPRHRGAGVGAMLVRAYLAEPLTPCTETIASMGRYVPLFERCGMRAVEAPRPMRDWRLMDALDSAGLTAMDLADGERAAVTLRRSFVRIEIDRWLNSARATRGLRSAPRSERAASAARALLARPMVLVHGTPEECQ